MSATIPDTLLVSEVLKPTGFDCPEDLESVSFNEAVSGGGTSAVLEDNKEVTITSNGTIEITPTAGHDYKGMKKVTASVSVAGADIEANKAATIDVSTYTAPVEITPTAGKDGMTKATVTLSNIPSGGSITYRAWTANTNDYVACAYVKDGVDIQVGMSPASIPGFTVRATGTCIEGAFINTIKSVSENTIVTNSGTPFPEIPWTRNASADITV